MEFTASNMARLTMADSRSPNAAGEAAATAFASQSVTVSAPATPAQPTQQSIAPAAATLHRAQESDRVYSTDSVSFICPPSAGHARLHFAAWLHRSPYAALADRHRRHPPRRVSHPRWQGPRARNPRSGRTRRNAYNLLLEFLDTGVGVRL